MPTDKKKVDPQYIINHIIKHYGDCIQVFAAADDVDVDYDLTMDLISSRIAEEKTPVQIRNLFGEVLNGENEIYRYFERKLPGLYDACEEFAQRNFQQDKYGKVVRKI